MPLKFPITIRVWEHKISGLVCSFSGLRTRKFFFSGTPVVLGNFNGNVLGAKLPKKAKKAKDWTSKHYFRGLSLGATDPEEVNQHMVDLAAREAAG